MLSDFCQFSTECGIFDFLGNMNARFAGNQYQPLSRQVDLRADAQPFTLRRLLGNTLHNHHVAALELLPIFEWQKRIEFLTDIYKSRMNRWPNGLHTSVIQGFRLSVRFFSFDVQLAKLTVLNNCCSCIISGIINNQFSLHHVINQ